MKDKDFVFLNIPALLEQKVWIKLPEEDGGPVSDILWAERNEAQLRSLVNFFRSNGLLRAGVAEEPLNIAQLVLRFSDFTPVGQRFIMTDAVGRWRASFDTNPRKLDSDVSYLVRKLQSVL